MPGSATQSVETHKPRKTPALHKHLGQYEGWEHQMAASCQGFLPGAEVLRPYETAATGGGGKWHNFAKNLRRARYIVPLPKTAAASRRTPHELSTTGVRD